MPVVIKRNGSPTYYFTGGGGGGDCDCDNDNDNDYVRVYDCVLTLCEFNLIKDIVDRVVRETDRLALLNNNSAGLGASLDVSMAWRDEDAEVRDEANVSPLGSHCDDLSQPSSKVAFTDGSMWCPLSSSSSSDSDSAGDAAEKKKSVSPRNAIEKYIHALHDEIVNTENAHKIQGAEWWVQDVGPGEPPKYFHTDCMLTPTSDGTYEKSHPLVATVLYLGEAGGATAVFDQTHQLGRLTPPTPNAAVACPPAVNRLLTFPGDRVHCVLHDPAHLGERKDQRLTLLVNMWEHRPSGIADLPQALVLDNHDDSSTDTILNNRTPTHIHAPCAHREPVAFDEHLKAWHRQQAPHELAVEMEICEGRPGQPHPAVCRYHQGHADFTTPRCARGEHTTTGLVGATATRKDSAENLHEHDTTLFWYEQQL